MTKDKPVRDLASILYDVRQNMMAAKRHLEELAEKNYATDDDELTPIIDLVDEALMRLKQFGNAGRWAE